MRRNTVCFTLTQTLAKHTIAFQCHNFFDKALCTGVLELYMIFFLSFKFLSTLFYQGTKKGFNAQNYIFHKKKLTSQVLRLGFTYFTYYFFHYNFENVTYFLTIKGIFFVNNGGCLIHARIYPISLKYLLSKKKKKRSPALHQ